MRLYSAAPVVALASAVLGWCLGLGPEARIARGALRPVAVVADGRLYQTDSAAATVGDLLTDLHIALRPLDRISPSPGTQLQDGMEVRVTRVTKRTQVEEVTMPAETVVLAAPERAAGYTQVLTEGQDGRVRREVKVWEKDGQVTTRTVVKERVVTPAKERVIVRGVGGAPTRGGDWHRPLRMTATAYDPGPRSCGRYADGYTATGAKAEKGVVATDPRVIAMGTRLYIPGYGFAVAADRGSAIRGMRIDLCFNTYGEAKQFGRRQVDVYLLK
jgi:3D (Asp-Asp-Asp) domain-containing protein